MVLVGGVGTQWPQESLLRLSDAAAVLTERRLGCKVPVLTCDVPARHTLSCRVTGHSGYKNQRTEASRGAALPSCPRGSAGLRAGWRLAMWSSDRQGLHLTRMAKCQFPKPRFLHCSAPTSLSRRLPAPSCLRHNSNAPAAPRCFALS